MTLRDAMLRRTQKPEVPEEPERLKNYLVEKIRVRLLQQMQEEKRETPRTVGR